MSHFQDILCLAYKGNCAIDGYILTHITRHRESYHPIASFCSLDRIAFRKPIPKYWIDTPPAIPNHTHKLADCHGGLSICFHPLTITTISNNTSMSRIVWWTSKQGILGRSRQQMVFDSHGPGARGRLCHSHCGK